MRKIISGLSYISRARNLAVCHRPPRLQLLKNPVSTISIAVRTMSGEGRKIDLTYEDLLGEKAKGGIVLVDVRNDNEVQKTGKLPDSIHIPLGDLQQALQISPEEFAKKYEGASQPTKESDLIFSCFGGTRSRKAMAAVQEIGFTKVRHYAGGWSDWEAKTKK